MVVVVVVVPLLQLLPLLLVVGELVAGELVEDGVTAGFNITLQLEGDIFDFLTFQYTHFHFKIIFRD